MNLLHIVATPRDDHSNTLKVSSAFIEGMCARHPDLAIDVIDLFARDLPAVAGENIESKYSLMVGQAIDKHHEQSWKQIEREIERFLAADIYVISTPMWNFGIPYTLKYYLDAIVQPGYLFRYNERGQPVGLVLGKKMVCITSRGGDYSAESPFHPYDFVEPYLRTIFGFVGVTDLHFINAQPMDVSLELRVAAIANATAEAQGLAADCDWSVATTVTEIESPAELKPAPIQ